MATQGSLGDESLIQKSVPKFKFAANEKNVKKRILFMTPNLIKEIVHSIKNNGYVKCLAEEGGTCPACEQGNYKKARYGMHILEYAAGPNGQAVTPFGFQVKALYFAKGTAEKLQTLFLSMGDKFAKLDVIVSCENTEFQLLNFMPVLDDRGSVFSQQPEQSKTEYRVLIKQQMDEIPLSEHMVKTVTPEVMTDMLSQKIQTYKPKKEDEAASPESASAAAPATAAQAALPLATAAAPAVTPAPAVSAASASSGKSAKDLMGELSI